MRDREFFFIDIHELVHDQVADQGMQTFGGYKIDLNCKTIGDQVFKVHKSHHANRLIEFYHQIEIALFGLAFPGVRAEDADVSDMILFTELMPHASQLVHYIGCISMRLKRLFVLQIYEQYGCMFCRVVGSSAVRPSIHYSGLGDYIGACRKL